MRYGIEQWWPPVTDDILCYDWGFSGSTLLRVTKIFDPMFVQFDDYMFAAAVIYDNAGAGANVFGNVVLVLGTMIKMSKCDIIKLGDHVTLISRVTKL